VRRIDSHHHFWKYSAEQYPWITESISVLRKDYLPPDLLRETQSTHVDAVISVQARQSVLETSWLLEQAANENWIQGVVGWLPLADENIRDVMEPFRDERKLCGLRHVVQDEPDDGFFDRPDFNRGITAMRDFGWSYDLLVYGRQLPFTIPFVDRHPEQLFVVDHIAKPNIASGKFDVNWARDFQELAKRPNVFCKFSGVVTQVSDPKWNLEQIQPYWDIAIESFGSKRLMFGTDWPVCLLKSSYADWVAAVSVFASKLGESEQRNFWSDTAILAYNIK